MQGFDPGTSFGDDVSRRYDTSSVRGDEGETVSFLARVAAGRPALELAVGTGRIALPLTAAGVEVEGIELSQDMVDRLREKPGPDGPDETAAPVRRAGRGGPGRGHARRLPLRPGHPDPGHQPRAHGRGRHPLRPDPPPPGQPTGVRPHGPSRRAAPPVPLGGLEGGAVHRRQLAPRQRVRVCGRVSRRSPM
jgi:hypothetical protein